MNIVIPKFSSVSLFLHFKILVLLGQYFSGHFKNLTSLLHSFSKQCVKFTEQNNEWFGWKYLHENKKQKKLNWAKICHI